VRYVPGPGNERVHPPAVEQALAADRMAFVHRVLPSGLQVMAGVDHASGAVTNQPPTAGATSTARRRFIFLREEARIR
jgi:hypothetical protein